MLLTITTRASILAAAVATLAGAAAAQPTTLPLVPAPREAAPLTPFPVGRGVHVEAGRDSADRFAAEELTATLRERGVATAATAAGADVRVRLLRRESPEARAL